MPSLVKQSIFFFIASQSTLCPLAFCLMSYCSRFLPLFFLLLLGFFPATALGAEAGAHHALTPEAPVLFSVPFFGMELPFTNSMVMLVGVITLLSLIIKLATLKLSLIPSTFQNLLELIYEQLFDFFANIMGKKLTERTFWFFATAFILILASNWLGLIPGVGIITYTNDRGITTPLFRGANADLNITLAMGCLFFLLWIYWGISSLGIKGLLKDIFAPKGDSKGLILLLLIPIFLLVGAIDCVSILLRPITLGARLYGNIFAGEQIIETMSSLVKSPWISWMPVLPFFFMELLVGLLQAVVFTLLCAVFVSIVCSHAEHPSDTEAKH